MDLLDQEIYLLLRYILVPCAGENTNIYNNEILRALNRLDNNYLFKSLLYIR